MNLRIAILAVALAGCQQRPPSPPQRSEASAVRNHRYELRAHYVPSQRGPTVHFTFQWLAPETIDLYPWELPWGKANVLELWARDSSGNELTGICPIDDPGLQAPITLSQGSLLEGDVLLTSPFPNLTEVLRRSPVVVMWLYPRRSASNRPPGHLTGRVYIPQTAP